MTNFFKREPFVTLGGGECKHCGDDAYYRIFVPHLDPMDLCGECLEAWDEN